MHRPTQTALLTVTLFAAVLPAAHAQRAFEGAGAGVLTCGDYLKWRESKRDIRELSSWTWGYISAYNQWSTYPPVREFPSDSTVAAYLDKHCRDNPLDSVFQGIVALVADLGGFRPPPRGKR